MKNDELELDINATFVNVTLSAKPVNGKYPLFDLMKASRGWWIMKKDVAEKIKYVFPVRRNKILGVFEVKSFEHDPGDTGNIRVNFELKMIPEQMRPLMEAANEELNSTHYVTKHFKI